jgi:hypothetical protein
VQRPALAQSPTDADHQQEREHGKKANPHRGLEAVTGGFAQLTLIGTMNLFHDERIASAMPKDRLRQRSAS